jgi:hypothetical protein
MQIALAGVAVNALVTWGTVKATFLWFRADLDRHEKRLDALEARPCILS